MPIEGGEPPSRSLEHVRLQSLGVDRDGRTKKAGAGQHRLLCLAKKRLWFVSFVASGTRTTRFLEFVQGAFSTDNDFGSSEGGSAG